MREEFEPAENLAPWFRTPLGDAVLAEETGLACELLERVFGFVAVSIGKAWPVEPYLNACAIRRCVRVHPHAGDLVSPLDNLALASDSVDAVLLPHTLEFVDSPQRLLREVDRVLVGEGHVLIFGFNPWSTWSARKALRRDCFPEKGRPLARSRLVDWLGLLGFEIIATPGLFRRPPIDHAGFLHRLDGIERLRWWPLPGNVYAILARKHVYAMTPKRPLRERRRRLIAGLPTPAAHNRDLQRKVPGKG